MELKELNILKKLSFGILSLTGSLVVVLGLIIYASMTSSNPYAALIDQPVVVSNRAPASLGDVTAAVTKVEAVPVVERAGKEIRTFDLDCDGRFVKTAVVAKASTSVKVDVEQVRLRRPKCDGDAAQTAIVNETNGYVATVFQTNKDQISTDYIHLSEGENKIKVNFQDRLGALHSSELLFSRSSAN